MSKRYPGGIIRKTPQTPSQTSAQGIWDMASVTQAVKENTWPIAGVPDPISRSLRFRASASAYLSRTPTSAGNRQKFTVSVWYKPGGISAGPSNANILNAGGDGSSLLIAGTGAFGATYQDRLLYREAGTSLFYWPMVFRDPSSWYHIVFAMDTTQSTAANRAKLYVNGVDQGAFSGTAITQNTSTSINAATAQYINLFNSSFYHSDLYYAEYYLIDGQQLTASSFGSTNDQTGVWQPIAYTGTYGTNGFYLPFSNTASTTTLGYDFSGNSNNFTTNNFSLTSGSTYDSMVDVPTQWIPYNTAGDTGALYRGNYCVWNPLKKTSGVTVSNANLTLTVGASINEGIQGTIGASSGKWYAEVTGGPDAPGVVLVTDAADYPGATANSYGYHANATKYNNGSSSSYGATFTSTDVIGIALDMDAGTVTFYKNNVSQGTAFTGLVGTFTFCGRPYGATSDWNFGQRPFAYAPPSGFKTLNTTNLPTPTIGATASTQAGKYMNVVTYTGTGSSQSITGLGFQPDLTWIKERNASADHGLYDAVRGVQKQLESNNFNVETTETTGLTAFGSDGFTVGALAQLNTSADTYVAWNWKANGAGSSNTAGSITSTVSANTTAGFSIVTYTGNGSSGATVGHGLSVTPSMVILKSRSSATNWQVKHSSLNANQNLNLNLTDAVDTAPGSGYVSAISSSTLTLLSGGSIGNVNGSGDTYVAYCFAQIAGYSAFGSYTGNGSSDGPFVFTGFRPRWILIKVSSGGTGSWLLYDTARNTYNVSQSILYPNLSNAEATTSSANLDILSNGFKLRTSNADFNGNTYTYVYAAFAESPFKFSLAR